jgi:adenosylcobinamide-phosphate synthase
MTFFSIVCVLVLEQLKAAPAVQIRTWTEGYATFLESRFNGGEARHGATAWMVGAALPAVLVLVLQIAFDALFPLLNLLLGVGILYLAMGFRQFSHFFTDIQLALRMGELDRARQLLGEWRGRSAERLSSAEVSRLAIERGIVAFHRHVLGPMLWFVVLGAAGAVLYRLSLEFAQRWSSAGESAGEGERFGQFAQQAFQALDWLPARLTAVSFAIVGDFEDAVYCWRTQAAQWADAATGILLASGAGALGIRLGMPLTDDFGIETRPELGLGDDADIEHLQSAIGLVWRALLLCLLLLALFTVASWVGA